MLRGGGGSAGAGSLPHRPQAALGRRRPVPPGHALPAPSACTVLLAASARPPRAPAAHAPLRARVRPSEHPREPSQSERRARARWSEKEAAAAAQAAPSVCPLLADAGKMEAVIEKECSALGGLFQTIISDMKGSYPVWEDFINKAGKLQSQLRCYACLSVEDLENFQRPPEKHPRRLTVSDKEKQMPGGKRLERIVRSVKCFLLK
ncbi:uncharacterized protein [Manis javanica]|uniref:uncharacterized protein isoform X5 n=1 Tax=Manis javanica TaxID=9974 RepID=UPI003C6D0173